MTHKEKNEKMAALDYTKTNAELERSVNMTPGTIAFWRKKFGHPNVGRVSAEQRFSAFVDKTSSPHGCWLWTGGKRGDYGAFCKYRISIGAHRASWILHNGPIPDGLQVLHDCPGGDNPLCVNPKHLWLGTGADNVRDMCKKGRQAKGDLHGFRLNPESISRGEQCHNAKLNTNQIIEIRSLVSSGESYADVARRFEIYRSTVRMIALRKAWAHVP